MLFKNLITGRGPKISNFTTLAIIVVSLVISRVAAENTTQPKWWQDESNFEKIKQIAGNISHSNPNSQICSLGQGPAWIVRTTELLADFNLIARQTFEYVPFSGSFEKDREIQNGSVTVFASQHYPSEEEEMNYRGLLGNLGLHPIDIASNYTAHGRKTVIVDFTSPERSVVLFVYILQNWAEEEDVDISDALKIVTITPRASSVRPIRAIFVDNGDFIVNVTNIEGDKEIMEKLVNGTGEGSNSDRFVPRYSTENEEQKSPGPVGLNSHSVHEILERIGAYVIKTAYTGTPSLKLKARVEDEL